jgi:hypothetical protein
MSLPSIAVISPRRPVAAPTASVAPPCITDFNCAFGAKSCPCIIRSNAPWTANENGPDADTVGAAAPPWWGT